MAAAAGALKGQIIANKTDDRAQDKDDCDRYDHKL